MDFSVGGRISDDGGVCGNWQNSTNAIKKLIGGGGGGGGDGAIGRRFVVFVVVGQ